MKKVIAVTMTVLFIFSFAACSKGEKVDSKQVLLVVSDASEKELQEIVESYDGFSNYKYSSEKESDKKLVKAILANPNITREILAKIDIDILLAIQSEGSLTANGNILYN